MPAYRVNELLACYWIENGIEVVSSKENEAVEESISEKLKQIRNRPKPKFNF